MNDMTSYALTFARTGEVNEWGRRRCVALVGDEVVVSLWLSDSDSDSKVAQTLLRRFIDGWVA